MKKVYLSIGACALLSSLVLVGCGSSNSSSENSTQTTAQNITVEDGPVIGAIVKDATGQIGKASNGTNVYTFDSEVTYPIIANGGYVDVNANQSFDADDIKLIIPLRASRGASITPITTYLADNPGKEEELKNSFGLDSIEDLYKLPSENKTIYLASEAVVDHLFQGKELKDLDINSIDLSISEEDKALIPEEFAKKKEKAHKVIMKADSSKYSIVTAPKEGEFDLSIAHINDVHSHIDSETMSLYFDGPEGTKTYTEVGGFPRVVTKLNEIKENNENVLVLNAGDTFQGTLFYSLFKGKADSDMLNMVEWDALALGNHEFDDGDEHLADYLTSLNLDSSKVLAANIEAPTGNPLDEKWNPYTIKTFENGEKVGIIGLDISGKTKESSNPSDEIVFLDEVETAQKYIDELKGMDVDKIVLLTHVGLTNDKAYATQLDGVDIIIGGDSHSLMGDFSDVGLTAEDTNYPYETKDSKGKKVCIAQAWQYAYIVGDLNVRFDDKGDVTNCYGTPTLLIGDEFKQKDSEGEKVTVSEDVKKSIKSIIAKNKNLEVVKQDSKTQEVLDTYSAKVDEQKAIVIGKAGETLGHNRIPGDKKDGVSDLALGSDIAPIVAKSFYDLSNKADACIQNAGGVRIAVEAGDINMKTAYDLLPFANTLFEIEMTASEIKAVLEDAVDEATTGGEDGEISTGAFPYSYALKYDVNMQEDKGSRVSNLELKDRQTGEWADLDLENAEKMYTIVTNSYTAGGKDGYVTFKTVQDERGKGVDTYLDYAMSFVRYVEAKEANGESLTKLPVEDHPIKSFYNGGKVLLYSTTTGEFMDKISVGSLPDMVKFSNDGKTIVVANEGEPSADYSNDPKGSISIISLDDEKKVSDVKTLNFDNVTIPEDVRIKPETEASKDLEPEYVAINEAGTKAWVSLQENNALAFVDLEKKEITEVKSLGKININDKGMDITADDVANVSKTNPDNIFALYQPDTIVSYTVNGADYVITANEGDDREYDDYEDYKKASKLDLSSSLDSALSDTDMEKLRVFTDLGKNSSDEYEELYMAGTRSFSIRDAQGTLVFDSGSDFENEIATNYANVFNTRVDDSVDVEDASDPKVQIGDDYYFWEGVDARTLKKGVEPEALAVAKIGEKVFAYIGLEKQGGFFVYDITVPASSTMVEYVNDIKYDMAPNEAGDLAPEGMVTFTQDSINYLVIANELSSSVSIYELASDGKATKLDSLSVGSFDKGAAEIVDYSVKDKKLFVTNGEDKTVDIIDVSTPSKLVKSGSVDFSAYASSVQSVSVKNGILAIAVE